jgi:ATP/maltotriose-dependent transcriptional regulator MalT/DNA-binding SARP family transcriptional activator
VNTTSASRHTVCSAARYAKLSCPQVHQALPRDRLFGLLDEARARHRIVWLAAPAGAGKSTLAASYLDRCGGSALWYQVDGGDADPATFMFYLAAARDLPRGTQDAADSGQLQRLFFRQFYAGLPAATVIVFDNMHEFDWDNAGPLMELALAEVPDTVSVLVLSREVPPARLARMEMNAQLRVLGWPELRFDPAEARALAALGGQGQVSDLWLERLDGWAAGIVMLRSLQDAAAADQHLAGRDAVFRYFAGEILGRLPRPWQRSLLLLSSMPCVPAADAEAITGEASVGRLLAQLYQSGLFLERRGGERPSYHFHALFREFLQLESAQRLPEAERRAFAMQAAACCAKDGQMELAAQLYAQAEAFAELSALLLRWAPALVASGRGQLLRDWMSCIPPTVAAEPWLAYWNGVALIQLAPAQARRTLERAAAQFAARGEAEGELAALASMVDTYDIEWTDPAALQQLLAAYALSLEAPAAQALGPARRLQVRSRWLQLLMFAAPGDPRMARAARQTLELLDGAADPLVQLSAATILLRHCEASGDAALGQWLVGWGQALAENSALGPAYRLRWLGQAGRWLSGSGQLERLQALTGTASLVVSSHDLDQKLLLFLELHHQLGVGDAAQALRLADALRPLVTPTKVRELVEFKFLDARVRALCGDLAGALQNVEEADMAGSEAGLPEPELEAIRLFAAAACALAGAFGRAEAQLARLPAPAGGAATLAGESAAFIRAHILFGRGALPAGRAALEDAFGAHRRRRASALFPALPRMAAALVARALELGVEPEHARAIVLRQGLAAPEDAGPAWPWPVAVHTLGRFALLLQGEASHPGGKAQQRPLLLLKALVQAGPGGKSQSALATQLWPDADDGKAALNVTIHRLRKLLDCDAAVVVSSGRVLLAPQLVWTDVRALTALCDGIERRRGQWGAEELSHAADQLLQLYQGAFCEGDEDGWLIAARAGWRTRFVQASTELGQQLEAQGAWEAARLLYLRSLEAETLNEAAYRGVMRCAHALGDSAAAFGAFRRCREMLSILLGQAPSAETAQLAVKLGLK